MMVDAGDDGEAVIRWLRGMAHCENTAYSYDAADFRETCCGADGSNAVAESTKYQPHIDRTGHSMPPV